MGAASVRRQGASGSVARKDDDAFKSNYAFGLQVDTVGGRKILDHGSGIEGFNTELAYYYPDGKLKTVGGMRKLRHRGLEQVKWMFTFATAAYNLIRIRNLAVA